MKERKKCSLLYFSQLLYIYPSTLNLFTTIDVLSKICFCPFRMFFWSVSPSWVQHPMKTSELRWVAFHTFHHNTALLVICVFTYLFCINSTSSTFNLHLQISNSHEWRPARVCVDVSEEVISTCFFIYIIRKMKFFQLFISFWSCLCPFRVIRVIPPPPPLHSMKHQIAYVELWEPFIQSPQQRWRTEKYFQSKCRLSKWPPLVKSRTLIHQKITSEILIGSVSSFESIRTPSVRLNAAWLILLTKAEINWYARANFQEKQGSGPKDDTQAEKFHCKKKKKCYVATQTTHFIYFSCCQTFPVIVNAEIKNILHVKNTFCKKKSHVLWLE